MTTATATPTDTSPVSEATPRAGEVLGIWVRHLTSLLFPLNALVFLWTGPHPWYVVPFFVIPIGIAFHLDMRPHTEQRQPVASLPAWPFDALVYLLAGLQLWVIVELARMFSTQQLFSIDMLLVFVIVGGSSGFSIITAHELIHRRKNWEQQLGRLLLCTVLYEHFYTEHLRGHHVRVGTDADPATANFGETYEGFFRRTVPAQFKSAWRLEARRLGDENMSLWDGRMLRNRILHGIAVGWGMALAIYLAWGGVAVAAFLIQAFFAIRLLEAVNYFEHWGLRRAARRVRPVDSWDTHSWFTYYGLTGLSRHADHHAYEKRPFQQLRVWEEAPLMPYGYVGMVDMVMGKNDEFQATATAELRRRGLGPFVEGAEPPLEETRAASGRGALTEKWKKLPTSLRIALPLVSALLVATAGVYWESGSELVGFGALLLRNAAIIGIFAAFFATHVFVQRRIQNNSVAWAAAFAVLAALGTAGQSWLA